MACSRETARCCGGGLLRRKGTTRTTFATPGAHKEIHASQVCVGRSLYRTDQTELSYHIVCMIADRCSCLCEDAAGDPVYRYICALRSPALCCCSQLSHAFQVVTHSAGPIFVQQVKNGARGYIIYLISSGYTNPTANQSVTISLSRTAATTLGNNASLHVVDRVSTAIVGAVGRASVVTVDVPRGALRILDIVE